MKEPSKLSEARKKLEKLSAPYKPSSARKKFGNSTRKYRRGVFWETDVEYIPKFEYCKFRPRKED